MALERREVEVWADWRGLPEATRIGTLHASPSRGKEVFSFEYAQAWETDNAQDLDLARDVAKLFRLTAKRAEEIIGEVVTVVKRWPAEAKKLGISRGEQERMADAFRVAAGA